MRSLLLAGVVFATLSGTAFAQLNLNIDDHEPLTKLPADQWITLAERIVNAKPIIGKPRVFMVNATTEELTVNCERWSLVGPKPYITGNPTSLPPWTVTEVDTNGFDGYCKNGVQAQSSTSIYRGRLNSANQNFSDATFIVFSPKNKQQ